MNGGFGVTNGKSRARRLAPYFVAAGLLLVAVLGNLASIADRLARSGRPVDLFVPAVDEITSALAWLALLPAIGWAFTRIAPPRFAWRAVLPLHAMLIPVASLTHFVMTRALRAIVHATHAEAVSIAVSWDGYVADLYKDVLTYLLLGLIYIGARRLIGRPEAVTRSDAEPKATAPPVIEIRDGAHTRYVSAGEVLWIEAAGNYVELHLFGARHLLMRSTLAKLAELLEGAGFLRVHRSRLVNLSRIASVENLPTGDALLLLSGGEKISASRRYRAALAQALAARSGGEDSHAQAPEPRT